MSKPAQPPDVSHAALFSFSFFFSFFFPPFFFLKTFSPPDRCLGPSCLLSRKKKKKRERGKVFKLRWARLRLACAHCASGPMDERCVFFHWRIPPPAPPCCSDARTHTHTHTNTGTHLGKPHTAAEVLNCQWNLRGKICHIIWNLPYFTGQIKWHRDVCFSWGTASVGISYDYMFVRFAACGRGTTDQINRPVAGQWDHTGNWNFVKIQPVWAPMLGVDP